MKRAVAIAVVLASAAVLLVLGTGASEDKGGYKVRAIFDNAVSVIPGEDVKIAGVKVGKITDLDVTPQQKAAVTIQINEKGYQDFRADARCTIRPQSLIGEKFVECTPTEPKAPGQPQAPALKKIADGQPGAGEYLLPLERTSTPVDIDLINNILRRPYAERLSIILGELGTGLAGRGQELRQVVRRANPALQQTDRVLAILADQNQVLADLARDSDTVIAPLARDRQRVAHTITASNQVAAATAERSVDLERTFERLPTFLRELRPTMARLSELSDQATPVLSDLGDVAPDVNRFIRELGPFSRAALPAIRSLGEAAEVGRPALVESRPTLRLVQRFARDAKPLAANLSALTTSINKTGGIERLLDYIFYQVTAINGFDQFGHYLRAALIVNLCSSYTIEPVAGCSSNFAGSEAAKGGEGDDKTLAATRAALRGEDPGVITEPALAEDSGPQEPTRSAAPAPAPAGGALRLPSLPLPGRLGDAVRGAGSAARTPPAPSAGARGTDPREGMLDYLLGAEE